MSSSKRLPDWRAVSRSPPHAGQITIALVVTLALLILLRLYSDAALIIMGQKRPPEVVAAFPPRRGELDDPISIRSFGLWLAPSPKGGAQVAGCRDGRRAIELITRRVPAALALTIKALACSGFR